MTLNAPSQRTFRDDLKLGIMTAFSAGMVNVAALILFFAFTSNVTGHFAILAEEISNGKWYQVFIVFLWILLFFTGSFLSNSIIINLQQQLRHWARAIPMLIEIICLCGVGYYGHYHYQETLMETEILVAVLLFSMGLQNGLTASISNFAVKTTHLTGLTTDLAIHLSMATRREWRRKPEVRNKILLLSCIAVSYLIGGIFAGSITGAFQYRVFFFIASVLLMTLVYDAVQQPSAASVPTAEEAARTGKSERPQASESPRRKLEPSYNA